MKEKETSRPAHGPGHDLIYARLNRDYPRDVDLVFERGIHGTEVRLTPGDTGAVLAALFGPLAGPAFVAGYLAAMAADARYRDGDPEDAAALDRVIGLTAEVR